MARPKNVLYFAENALSAIQGGGIVAYAVLKGLAPERLLGFYDYRNITPVPEYADRFIYLGDWRTPELLHNINRLTRGRTVGFLHRRLTDKYIERDFAFVQEHIARTGFKPQIVYFAGLSYRYLRLAVMTAEHYDLPMVQLNMDDWVAQERQTAGPRWGEMWYRRTIQQLTRASERSLVSTSNSPRLAARLSAMTGHRHVAANNCCDDSMTLASTARPARNEVPTIVYAGAMNQHLQGETLKILASAVTELNAEGTPVHLHIYTPWEFAPAANAIAVPTAVFYKGQVGRAQLADIYRQADFLVTTVTHREGNIALFRHSLSTKLSEYLCAGRPVISMGHKDWHLHEYVQDNGCGFSIAIDEHYARASIKQQLRRLLATSPARLAAIGRRNRDLWARAHDVQVMARDTRRAVGLLAPTPAARNAARGVVWVGETVGGQVRWVPVAKLKAICRRLFDMFDHRTVDIIGGHVHAYPSLEELVDYCEDIGLQPEVVDGADLDEQGRWEVAGAAWSLADEQRSPDGPLRETGSIFEQVAALRGPGPADSPERRAVNQLSVRLPESGIRKANVWLYGSLAVGQDVAKAIERHAWLPKAVQIAGFLSSPGHCKADRLDGRTWKAIDTVSPDAVDFVVVTSETSRLAIQEELSRHDLLDRIVPIYGMAGTLPACGYERVPGDPGQSFVRGASALDYAKRELAARLATTETPAAAAPLEDSAGEQVAA